GGGGGAPRGGWGGAGPRRRAGRGSESGPTAGPELRKPTHAAPIASGRLPQALEMRTRSRLPPRLTRGIIRSVWLLKAAPSAGAGAAVQVPTQCVVFFIALYASLCPFSRSRRLGLQPLQPVGHSAIRRRGAEMLASLCTRIRVSVPEKRLFGNPRWHAH